MNNKVFIGFCREVSLVHAISILIKKGLEVIAFDSVPYAPGLHVRGLKNTFINPEIIKNEVAYVDFLKQISRDSPDAALLTGDEYTSHIICKYQEQLRNHYRFLAPDYATYQQVVNKYSLSNLAKENNLSIPSTFEFKGLDPNNLTYPVMIKPKIGAGGRGQIKFTSSSQVKAFTESYSNILEDFFIQEYVPGPTSNLYTVNLILDQNSGPVCTFSANRLSVFTSSQIPEGATTFIRSIRLDDLIQVCLNFMQKIKWVGIAELEFKKDSRDGEFKLLEINPRLWSWTKLATMSGVDFASNYIAALGQKTKADELNAVSFSFQEGIHYLRPLSDQYANLVRLFRRELSTREYINQILQRLKQLFSGKLVIERFEGFRWFYCHLRQRNKYI